MPISQTWYTCTHRSLNKLAKNCRNFQMHFHKEEKVFWLKFPQSCFFRGQMTQSSLVQVINWHLKAGNPWLKSVICLGPVHWHILSPGLNELNKYAPQALVTLFVGLSILEKKCILIYGWAWNSTDLVMWIWPPECQICEILVHQGVIEPTRLKK